jgi:tryptophan-rich sensory protein
MTRPLPLPPGPLGLLACMIAALFLAALVSVTLIVLLPGGEGSIDQLLPDSGPLGALISTIVPYVWLALFAGLGAAFWLVQGTAPHMTRAGWSVIGLLALCSVYPMLGAGLTEPSFAVVGNAAVIIAALIVEGICRPVSCKADWLVTPVWVWVSIATAGLVALELGLPF